MSMKQRFDIAQLKNPEKTYKPRIRDTEITISEVYKDLAFYGLPEAAVLQKYPGMLPEDLAAVREYTANSIKSRDCDEITGRKILSKEQLVNGRYYKGRCRNASVARWNAEENCFYHWREKFDKLFIETIMYPTDETEPWWDIFNPLEELPNPKFEIPFDSEARFDGNPIDLTEYEEEVWRGWDSSETG